MTGFLSITISQELLNFTNNEELKLILEYYGNYFLQNSTISLILNVNDYKGGDSQNLNIYLITTISILSVLLPLPLLYRFKKGRKKMLTEISIKY
jgi:hypothetical protein